VIELDIRPATLEDAGLAADLMTSAYPPEPMDPLVTRYRWAHPRADWTYGRFIAELKGQPVAHLWSAHGPWEKVPERHCDLGIDVNQAHQSDEVMDLAAEWIAGHAVEDGARILNAYAAEDEPNVLKALDRLGFKRDRSEKVWQLDLHKHGKRLLAEATAARQKMKSDGIELLPLAEWPGPEAYERLHALNEAAIKDIPTSFPILPQTLAEFTERMNAPDLPHDRLWLARDGNRAVAVSFLRFPPVRGHVWTGFTCSDPDYRGRGIARAVKLQGLAQAVELGIPFVRTDNDSENAPMLHINEALGYDPRPGFMTLVKRVDSQ
jgi:RimJ/RimL family protein N-acetyltransferase